MSILHESGAYMHRLILSRSGGDHSNGDGHAPSLEAMTLKQRATQVPGMECY